MLANYSSKKKKKEKRISPYWTRKTSSHSGWVKKKRFKSHEDQRIEEEIASYNLTEACLRAEVNTEESGLIRIRVVNKRSYATKDVEVANADDVYQLLLDRFISII